MAVFWRAGLEVLTAGVSSGYGRYANAVELQPVQHPSLCNTSGALRPFPTASFEGIECRHALLSRD